MCVCSACLIWIGFVHSLVTKWRARTLCDWRIRVWALFACWASKRTNELASERTHSEIDTFKSYSMSYTIHFVFSSLFSVDLWLPHWHWIIMMACTNCIIFSSQLSTPNMHTKRRRRKKQNRKVTKTITKNLTTNNRLRAAWCYGCLFNCCVAHYNSVWSVRHCFGCSSLLLAICAIEHHNSATLNHRLYPFWHTRPNAMQLVVIAQEVLNSDSRVMRERIRAIDSIELNENWRKKKERMIDSTFVRMDYVSICNVASFAINGQRTLWL